MRWVAVFLFVALACGACSKGPPPSVPKPGSAIQKPGDGKEHTTDHAPSGPRSDLSVINKAIDNYEKTHKQTSDKKPEPSPDWWMVDLTCALVFVGIVQMITFICQAILIRQSLNLTEDALHMTERAYFSVDSVTVETFPSIQLPVFNLRNTGRTPAFTAEAQGGFCRGPLPAEPDFGDTRYNRRAIIPTGGNFTYTVSRDIRSIEGGDHVFCSVTYFDIFGEKRIFNCMALAIGRQHAPVTFIVTGAPIGRETYDYAD